MTDYRISRSVVTGAIGILAAIAAAAGLPVSAQNAAKTKTASVAPAATSAASPAVESPSKSSDEMPMVPEPKQVGGEPQSVVQVANLIYAGVKSSHCFSDHFLVTAEKESAISTSRRFHAVKLSSDELFNFPLIIMTGEGSFELTDKERENLRKYVERGGFLLASAGCSSHEWDRSFRREMALVFPQNSLRPISMDHTLFNTVFEIKQLHAKHGTPRPLDGISMGERLGVVYSQDGLNDTAHTQGCCCCGGNEITNCIQVNVNILAYSLLF
ncbi:MAG TPA: DUF4159 domain-containing protein [Planctomycetaceae bacterium]|nr:DUF4159 domain-containing protein [Planctomycetaceae bacterium]